MVRCEIVNANPVQNLHLGSSNLTTPDDFPEDCLVLFLLHSRGAYEKFTLYQT